MIAWTELQVGALLLSFLPVSLQEQISARKYFYKSALVQALVFLFPNLHISDNRSKSNQQRWAACHLCRRAPDQGWHHHAVWHRLLTRHYGPGVLLIQLLPCAPAGFCQL
jgi:hypothetical protein